ncbi:hypothetical protein D3C86_1711630 [compost metagenome]
MFSASTASRDSTHVSVGVVIARERLLETEMLHAVPGTVTPIVRVPTPSVAVMPVGVPIAVSRPRVISAAVASASDAKL